MGRSNNFARVGLACGAHLGGNTLRDLVGHIRTTVSRPLQNLSSYLPIIIAVCCVPGLASLVSTSPAPSCSFVLFVLISLLGIKSTWYGLPNGFNLQSNHPRGRNCKSTQLATQAESHGPNMILLSALRSCGIDLHPWIAPEQIDPALGFSSTHSPSPATVPVTSYQIISEPLRCHDAELSLDITVLTAAPQVHATQFMSLESLDAEGDVLGTMVKGITHIQPLAAHNHDGIPKLCSNTTDPIPNFTVPNRFDPRNNTKSSERWIFTQLLCLAVLSNLGSRCVQRKYFWTTLETMMKVPELPRKPKKRSYPLTPPSRPPTTRSSPHRHSRRIGKIFVLGSLFLYALSSGTGSSSFFGFVDSGGSGQPPNDTNPGSQWENDMWLRHDPYSEIPVLTRAGPEGSARTDEIPRLPAHVQDTAASTIHIRISPPTPEQVNLSPPPPPPPNLNVPGQQDGVELHPEGVSYVIPPQGYFGHTAFSQPGPMGSYGEQTPHHPPAPRPSRHTSPSQMPPQPGASNRAGLHIPVQRAHAPPVETLPRFAANLAQTPQSGCPFGTGMPLDDASPDHLRQWVSTLGQPDPPPQPDLDERGQSAYLRGYADARRDLIAGIVAVAQANPQLARAEPSTHAQQGEVPVSLLPATPTPQSDQVVSNPSPPAVAQEVSNKPGSEPYAPPTPPCDNTDPEPPFETLGASTDPATDSQAPHQESVPDTQNVDHHTPETIHAPQPVAPVPVTSSPPPPPAPAPTPSLVPAAPYPSLPTPAATPVTQAENNKPHVCPICGAAYPRPYLLRDHMTSKHGNGKRKSGLSCSRPDIPVATEKPYACDFEGCDSRFSTRSNMRKHFNQKHRGSGTPRRNDTNQAGPSS